MTTRLTYSETKALLESTVHDENVPWALLGMVMESVQYHEICNEDFTSYTDWLRKFAKETGKTQSTLWRYRGAWEHYVSIQSKLERYSIRTMDVYEFSRLASAENFEILEKLERVAPEEIMEDLYVKVFAGTLRRNDLREKWNIFKGVLEGKTARGKNAVVPKFKSRNFVDSTAGNMTKFQSSLVFNVLKDEFHIRINNEGIEQHVHRFYTNYKIDKKTLDALVVIKYNNSEIHLHGMYKRESSITAQAKKFLEFYASVCDFVWIICDDIYYHNNVIFDEIQLDEWGIITESNDLVINIEKMATRSQAKEKDRDRLLEMILLNSF
jgi:hypothetical protein